MASYREQAALRQQEPQLHLPRELEGLICHAGTGQYARGGVSACAVASLNFARVILEKEEDGLQGLELVRAVASRETVEEIVSVCRSQWPQELHVEVEDLLEAPVFKHSLKQATCHYGMPNLDNFKRLLRDASNISDRSKSSAISVITRPPEVIACARTQANVFIVFDSHPRPQHATGAGLFLTADHEHAARHLHDLLHVDSRILADSSLQWQAQLLANFSAHVFVRERFPPCGPTKALLDCSLEALSLRTRAASVGTQNQTLTEMNEQLEDEVDDLKVENRRLQRELDALRASVASMERERRPPSVSRDSPMPSGKGKGRAEPSVSQSIGGHSSQSSSSLQAPQRPHYRASQSSLASSSNGTERADIDEGTNGSLAWQLQHDFEQEDAQFAADRLLVKSLTQATFDCSICLETLPEHSRARIPGCEHTTCRDCLGQHITNVVREHRYPIYCPACIGDGPKAEITQGVIFDVGIPEKEYTVFEEMQLSMLSTLVHCRGCQGSMFVDKAEFEATKIIACPMPGCTYAWCKACQQRIALTTSPDEPPHSCDGSAELDHLMKQRGWKHCPGCTTPVMKESGCNHMTCMSPGCNTHFCYRCGEKIVSSAMGSEIKRAVSAHYRRCTLFQVPW